MRLLDNQRETIEQVRKSRRLIELSRTPVENAREDIARSQAAIAASHRSLGILNNGPGDRVCPISTIQLTV
jgi:hypothetical protein